MTFTQANESTSCSHGMVCMSHDQTTDTTPDVSMLEKLSFNLSGDPNSREFNCTLRWIIYKIVEANKGITYVNLKKILRGEYGIDKRVMDTAISSLTSATLFNCITKWRNPKLIDVGEEVGIHLFVNETESETFTSWKAQIGQDFPELGEFRAPVLPARSAIRKTTK